MVFGLLWPLLSLRLDVYNGILLSSLWDAAFDGGMITFAVQEYPLSQPP
jgi:hypothetical protein